MNPTNGVEFGKKVREHRKRLGLNQQQYGERFEVNRITVNRWEAGTTIPDGDHMTRLLEEIRAGEAQAIEKEEDTYQLSLPLEELVGLELKISPGTADSVQFQARWRRLTRLQA
jgi:transcriptional regulator with XRE-family HTH domain